MVYTQAGGSYVVARENFGPRVAQIASVALMIDYIVTVAVQAAAGTAAITSAVAEPARSLHSVWRSRVVVVLLLAFGNLRGVREAGTAFAFPTYFFVDHGRRWSWSSAWCARSSATCRTDALDLARAQISRVDRQAPRDLHRARRSSCCSRRSPTAARR